MHAISTLQARYLPAISTLYACYEHVNRTFLVLYIAMRMWSGRTRGELLESFWRALGELLENFWRAWGELLESFWRAAGELLESCWNS